MTNILVPAPRPDNKAVFAAEVTRIRESLSLRKRDLAHLSGMDPSYMTLIERDGYIPSIKMMDAMVAALRYSGASEKDLVKLEMLCEYKPGGLVKTPSILEVIVKMCQMSEDEQKEFAKKVRSMFKESGSTTR